MKNKILSLVIFLIPIFSVHATANEELARGIRYNCGEQNDALKEIVRTILSEASDFFNKVNPAVAEKIAERIVSRKLEIKCVERRILTVLGSNGDASPLKRGGFRIRIIDDMVPAGPTLLLKSILFHELLHFAGVSNLGVAEHNQVFYGVDPLTDNVYSCAYALYPAQIPNLFLDHALALESCKLALTPGVRAARPE